MTDMPSQPDPDLVNDLFWGIFKPQFVRMALQLDVFSPLAPGPATAEEVALSCQADAQGIRALLDYLCSLHVLERREDRYGLTPSAATFLVRGRKAYAGDMILHYTDRALCDSILQSIRTGRPAWLGENFVQDAWLESYSTSRIAKSLALWQAAGLRPQEREQTRVLDIACGCAIKSLCLAQLSPTAHVTCLDTPDVLVVARDLAGRMGVSDQVTYRPANLLDADLGQEQYDAVLLGQITYYLTTDQNRDLFRRVYRTLAAGGMLVIDCAMSSDELAVFPSFATLFLWANSGGAAHSFASYRAWLHDAGFGAANQLGERWLSAVK